MRGTEKAFRTPCQRILSLPYRLPVRCDAINSARVDLTYERWGAHGAEEVTINADASKSWPSFFIRNSFQVLAVAQMRRCGRKGLELSSSFVRL